MIALVVGLALGCGLLLVASAFVGVPTIAVRAPHWWVRWSDVVVRAGMTGLTPVRLLGLSALVVVTTFLLVLAWSSTPTVSLALGLVLAPLPTMVVAARSRARTALIRSRWPEVVDSLVAGVRAGASLPELLIDLGEDGPEELRPHFRSFARVYRSEGRFSDALDSLKRGFADPVADRIVEALRLAREVGGSDLAALLRDLGVLLREDARIRGEMEARQSWTVNAARLGVAAPWLVLVMISGQANAAHAYSTPQGVVVLVGGAVASAAAYLVMQRIGRLPTEGRSLR